MKKLLSYLFVFFTTSVMLIACQPKEDGNKDQEVTYARQAYDRCIQSRGQDACNVIRGGSVMSIREYYGNANAGLGYNTGYNTGLGLGYNTGLYGSMQLTTAQINAYFDYVRRQASKEETVTLANNYINGSQQWGAGVNGLYTQPNAGNCTAYGCFH